MKLAVLLSPALSQPRFHRRAQMLLDTGFHVQVYSFKREFNTGNTYPAGVEVIELGRVLTRNYLNRIPRLFGAARSIKHHEKSRQSSPALVYAFGLDMALLATFSMPSGIPLVYETGDLQNPLPHRSLKSKAMAEVEKIAIRRAHLLAATSSKFISDYFNIIHPGADSFSVIIENMVSRKTSLLFDRPKVPKSPSSPIKIGFVGRLRYPRCLIPLMDAVTGEGEKFELHLYGVGQLLEIVQEYAQKSPNIFYHGHFKNPDDLSDVYRSIDINYVVYDNHDPNVRLALPNKLYESPFFGTPLIVASRTYLSERVSEAGVGFVVDPDSPGFAENLLAGLTVENLVELSRRALDVPTSELVENNKDLSIRLASLAGPGPG